MLMLEHERICCPWTWTGGGEAFLGSDCPKAFAARFCFSRRARSISRRTRDDFMEFKLALVRTKNTHGSAQNLILKASINFVPRSTVGRQDYVDNIKPVPNVEMISF